MLLMHLDSLAAVLIMLLILTSKDLCSKLLYFSGLTLNLWECMYYGEGFLKAVLPTGL